MDVFSTYYRLHIDNRMKRWNLLKYILNPIDLLSILFAFQCSYLICYFNKGGVFYSDNNVLRLFFFILPFWLLVLSLVKITAIPPKRFKVLFFLYLQSSISIFFLLTLLYFFLKIDSVSRLFVAGLPFFGFLFLFFGRIFTYKILKFLGAKGYNHTNIIIIADNYSFPFIQNLLSKKELGYKIVVIFTESVIIKYKYEDITIILPEKFLGILSDLIEVDFVDEVLYLKEKPNTGEVREILKACEDMGVTLRLKYKEEKVSLSSAVRSDIAEGKFLSFISIPNNSFSLAIKKTLDINIALLMIVVLSPVLIAISLLIKLTSRGPVISNLIKTGKRGHQIKIYRFRTISVNAERKTSYPDYEMKIDGLESETTEDSEFTKIGRFLFKSGLDQLPQLFNVLKGEMPFFAPPHPLQRESKKSPDKNHK
jgi:lipopolysaccharide/colanic/teichoic acid biosynthesis glycosyltransferase